MINLEPLDKEEEVHGYYERIPAARGQEEWIFHQLVVAEGNLRTSQMIIKQHFTL